jgi:hypothetical protein
MKNLIIIVLCLVLFNAVVSAQLKSQVEQQTSPSLYLVHPASGLGGLFGWFDPNRFSMRHNFSMSYVTAGGVGLSLASYTNSMLYQVADPLNVRFDVTMQTSPFGNYGSVNQNAFNNLFLSRAEVNYKPWENFQVQLQYRQIPFSPYGYYRPYGSSLLLGDE